MLIVKLEIRNGKHNDRNCSCSILCFKRRDERARMQNNLMAIVYEIKAYRAEVSQSEELCSQMLESKSRDRDIY